MAHLSYPSPEEVQLRLGPRENAILAVVRHWAWWLRAEVEGKLPGYTEVATVTLTAERAQDATIREILDRSFQLVFPPDGGEGIAMERAPVASSKRKRK